MPAPRPTADVRYLRPALVASAVLLLYNNLVSLVPLETRQDFLLYSNLSLTAIALLAAYALDLRPSDLGLTPRAVARSSLWGLAIGLVLALPPVAFIVLSPFVTGETVQAGDINDLSPGEMALRMAVRIPIGTALTEELVFRGVLFALWQKAAGLGGAVMGTSAVFALWHLVITFGSVADSEVVEGPALIVLGYVGSLLALFIGGLFFALLRWRTGSVAGPFFVHWLTVALMTLAVWARD